MIAGRVARKMAFATLLRFLSITPLCMGVLSAGSFWDEKPWTDWSKKEVEKILRNSPWATERWEWRSAKPVRLGYARLAQLKNPGIPEKELDRIINDPLYQRFYMVKIDYVVTVGGVGVFYEPGIPSVRDWINEMETLSLEHLKDHVYLLKKNKQRIPLQGYLPPSKTGGSAVVFLFPRFNENGLANIMIEDKEVRFLWGSSSGWGVDRFALDLKKLLFHGALEL